MRGMVLGLALATLACAPARAAELELAVRGIAHDKGNLRMAVYADAESFRKEPRARVVKVRPTRSGELDERIELPPGRYAVIVYHDENGNGDMDRFLGMIPTEGYGLSNNPEVSGPPRFEECSFDLVDSLRGGIDLRY
ncbi:MAG: DUF2141 domain-containing protein [Pseudomonadota bacterium]